MSAAALEFLREKEQGKLKSVLKGVRATLDEYREVINDHYVACKRSIIQDKAVLQQRLEKRQVSGKGDTGEERK